MHRGLRLNESKYGFHAGSRLLTGSAAKSSIVSLRQAKGFFHPDSDVEERGVVVLFPSNPIGFKDYSYRLRSSTEEQLGSKWYFNTLSNLMPLKPLVKKWEWSCIREILRSNLSLHHFRFATQMRKVEHIRIRGKKVSYFVICRLATGSVPKDGDALWTVYVSIAPVREWREGVYRDQDPELVGQFSQIAQKWAAQTGLSHLLRGEKDPEGSGSAVWRISPGKPEGYRGPFLGLDVWNEHDDGAQPEFVIPGSCSAILPQKPCLKLIMVDLETAVRAFETAFQPFFGDDPVTEEINFTILDSELPEFKTLAEPLFGSPWLQEMGGFAQPGYVPRVDDSIPAWTIQPVAYFKILGSWRTIDLLKEPEGWRFLVTGRYTKDPLKHRHIRDELARKAGMTSETLWEPQDAGEGWLGVPG